MWEICCGGGTLCRYVHYVVEAVRCVNVGIMLCMWQTDVQATDTSGYVAETAKHRFMATSSIRTGNGTQSTDPWLLRLYVPETATSHLPVSMATVAG